MTKREDADKIAKDGHIKDCVRLLKELPTMECNVRLPRSTTWENIIEIRTEMVEEIMEYWKTGKTDQIRISKSERSQKDIQHFK